MMLLVINTVLAFLLLLYIVWRNRKEIGISRITEVQKLCKQFIKL
jgi:hypothetical protein